MHDERRHDLYRAEKINVVAFIYLDLDLDRVLGGRIRNYDSRCPHLERLPGAASSVESTRKQG